MLSEIDPDALDHICDNIARVRRFVEGFDLDGFIADDKMFYAATPCVKIISDAFRRLSRAFKTRFPEFHGRMSPALAASTATATRTFKNVAFGRQFTKLCPCFASWSRWRCAMGSSPSQRPARR
jgi:hypothetical protein